MNPTGTRVYVANNFSDNVSVIDAATNSVVTVVNVGHIPAAFGQFIGPAPAPPAQWAPFAYIANSYSNSLSVIDTATNTVIATVPLGGIDGGAVDTAGTRFYARQGSGIAVFDTTTRTVIASIPLSGFLQGVAVNQADTRVYVANQQPKQRRRH